MRRYVIRCPGGYLSALGPSGGAWHPDQRRALRVRGRDAARDVAALARANLTRAGASYLAERVRRVALRWTP